MRLRVSGVSQADNVICLTYSLPNFNHKVKLTFDRGYGKRSFVDTMIFKKALKSPHLQHL